MNFSGNINILFSCIVDSATKCGMQRYPSGNTRSHSTVLQSSELHGVVPVNPMVNYRPFETSLVF